MMKCHGVIGPEPGALESIPEEFRGQLGELKFSMSYAEKFTRSGPTYNGAFMISKRTLVCLAWKRKNQIFRMLIRFTQFPEKTTGIGVRRDFREFAIFKSQFDTACEKILNKLNLSDYHG